MPTYLVSLELPMARFRQVEVIAVPANVGLLGRDVLNNLYVDLNGPDLTFAMQVKREA